MEALRHDIATNFGQGNPPHPDDVVRWDGFDQLEKESASNFYPGKSWRDVLQYLQGLKDKPGFGAAYNLEEWSVLSREALPYYLRAFLEFLFETLESAEPDEEFTYFLLGQLYQVVYMHKGSPFNSNQTLILQRVAQFIRRRAEGNETFPFFHRDIQNQVDQFVAEIEAYRG